MSPGIKDTRENWIMHSRSHLEPKKSIYSVVIDKHGERAEK